MKTRFFALFLVLTVSVACLQAGTRDAAWDEVDLAITRGQPKTAIERLEAIIIGSVSDHSYGEAVRAIGRKVSIEGLVEARKPEEKTRLLESAIGRLEMIAAGAVDDQCYEGAVCAIGRRIALEGMLRGHTPEEKIVLLQAEIEKAPVPMRPVMEAILAHWYWQYFQHNRWRFHQRTQTAVAPGPDIQTWDLARILAEIGRHFDAALADTEALQSTPIGTLDSLVAGGTVPDSYRPTLYDFLAYEALSFYQTGEQAATVAEDAFEIEVASPIFGDTDEFVAWKPFDVAHGGPFDVAHGGPFDVAHGGPFDVAHGGPFDVAHGGPFDAAQCGSKTGDTASPKYKAVALYQALLRFHAQDADRSAFLDADLARLNFGFNVATGDDKLARYRAAVMHLAEGAQRAGHEIAARAWADLAEHLPEPTEAHAAAERGLAASPAGNGAARCFNLIQSLEAKSATLGTEMVWSPAGATLAITYKNIGKVFFRAVAVDFEDVLNKDFDLGREHLRTLLAQKPALAWEADLPPTPDFKERTEKLPAPQMLKPGLYVVIAGHRPDFGEEDNQTGATLVCVSNLALVLRDRADGRDDGFVVRADSGEPVAGATVRFRFEAGEDKHGQLASTTTDADGCFHMPSSRDDGRQVVVVAEQGGQRVSSAGLRHLRKRENQASKAQSRTTFFTDRAIYRPGQAINYKGIALRADSAGGHYEVVARKRIVVVFSDPNGKEIARAEHKTNDYGSFSGVFTAPRDRATGQMSIWVDGPLAGATWFSVEEYKRPKFQVELAPPAEAPKLDAAVTVTGRAAAYTGVAVGGAKVQWRVERAARVPRWCWWFRPAENKAIAHGTTTTADDGSFQIEFVAAPDREIPAKNDPVFTYTIHAAVTDATGETRTESREVRVGYTALQAAIMVTDWQTPEKPVAFTLATTTLNDVPQVASGSLKVYALQQPAAVVRAALTVARWWSNDEPKPDPANPESWEMGALVAERTFTTDATGRATVEVPLASGLYRAVVETQDRFAQKVTTRRRVEVVDPAAKHYGVKVPELFTAPTFSVEPGETFEALWGTGYASGRALVEVECAGRLLQRYWTRPGRTQEKIKQAVTEEMRGGFTVRVLYVRENRIYTNEARVTVPWTNKQLTVKWETFRSKLMPGQKETWTAVVTGPDAKRASAEMVATLYDASLDQFRAFAWPRVFDGFRSETGRTGVQLQNRMIDFEEVWGNWEKYHRPAVWLYRAFGVDVLSDLWGAQYAKLIPPAPVAADEEVVVLSPFEVTAVDSTGYCAATTLAGSRISTQLYDVGSAVTVVPDEFLQDTGATDNASLLRYTTGTEAAGVASGPSARLKPDLSKVAARKNLNETAFFFPHLTADKDGVVRMTFTMPEALTEWKFMGFAHDAQLRAGGLIDTVVTAKDLMVQPNPPRFVREGDAIEFTVKVSNQSDRPQQGVVKLTFADAATLAPADAALGNTATEHSFDVPAKQSRSYSWRIAVPDGLGFLTYKAVAATQQASDGEEGFLPVLSHRILVTESLPLPIRGKSTKSFAFQKLLDSGKSDTLRHQSLTVQMTSQPAWYAVMALPYLMEFPYECSEQVFNRLYANALARHIANSDPKIRRVFELWKNTPAPDSPLTKNQDLKSVLLEETPWVREAQSESEAHRNVGVLFDANRLDDATARALRKLTDQQLEGGLWPWFPGGKPSEYISLYIVTGFGRLRHLGVAIDTTPAVKALAGLDAWMAKRHAETLRGPDPDSHVPSHLESIYLYGRSFFLVERPIASQHRAAVDFFLARARQHWLRTDCRMCQAQLALALQRFGDKQTPRAIVASLKERSVNDEELGMFWRDTELSWWWYRAPIETQATMIEAFAEVGGDQRAVDDCQVWLLKQKQTQDWKTTKATADAIYALLLDGRNLLASDALVEVALGGTAIKPAKAEAGTGFYEQKFAGAAIKPAMGQVTVKKVDDGVSWGSVHWQYLEDLAKVTPHEGTPLKLKKSLWVKQTTKKGQELVPVTGPIAVGDELVVRIELRTDRDMEFVHLKDQRGSGTEPVSVLSQYTYQDGLAYYESTRDTASHFFIDYLPKGTYVFEYSTRVQLKGAYQTGIAEIQCMYAPEFNSHSESIPLEVK